MRRLFLMIRKYLNIEGIDRIVTAGIVKNKTLRTEFPV